MKLLPRLILVFTAALPTSVAAQVAAQKELVGTWIWTAWKATPSEPTDEVILTLRTDGTWVRSYTRDGVEHPEWKPASGQWYLSGDSLWFGNPAATDTISEYRGLGRTVVPKWPAKSFLLHGDSLYVDVHEAAKRDAAGRAIPRNLLYVEHYRRATTQP